MLKVLLIVNNKPYAAEVLSRVVSVSAPYIVTDEVPQHLAKADGLFNQTVVC